MQPAKGLFPKDSKGQIFRTVIEIVIIVNRQEYGLDR